MRTALKLSALIDGFSRTFGWIAEYMVLFCCLISAGNALSRYLFNYSTNALLEVQWYLFGFVVLMGASSTLQRNEHVRVDLVYGSVSDKTRLYIDAIGFLLFLIPTALYLAWMCWPFFALSWQQQEMSQNSGGLIRWPIKLVLVAGFLLLAVQGLSELIKRVAAITGLIGLDTTYEKPLQ